MVVKPSIVEIPEADRRNLGFEWSQERGQGFPTVKVISSAKVDQIQEHSQQLFL